MPHETTPLTPRQKRAEKAERARKILAGGKLGRDDSDDELGTEDHPWQWVYEKKEENQDSTGESADESDNGEKTPRSTKRRRIASKTSGKKIIGARMGNFMCKVGDTVLLKAEGSNAAWVAMIWNFLEDDEGEKCANFLCGYILSSLKPQGLTHFRVCQ